MVDGNISRNNSYGVFVLSMLSETPGFSEASLLFPPLQSSFGLHKGVRHLQQSVGQCYTALKTREYKSTRHTVIEKSVKGKDDGRKQDEPLLTTEKVLSETERCE